MTVFGPWLNKEVLARLRAIYRGVTIGNQSSVPLHLCASMQDSDPTRRFCKDASAGTDPGALGPE